MNDAERAAALARAREAATYGRLPGGPVTAPPDVRAGETPEGVFSALDLFDVGAWAQAVPCPMPGGKRVWVHQVTPDDALWLNTQARADARGKQFATPQDEAEWRIRRAQVYQVVCVARVAVTPGAARVFAPAHADALQKNLPFAVIERIIGLSEQADAVSEGERQVVADFFGGCRSWALTCASRSATDTPEQWRRSLEDFASCVSRVKERGFLIPADVDEVRALAGEQE